MDKLIFLGTAGDNISGGRRASGGIILQTEGMQFVIDPGPGTLTRSRLHKINPRETTAILVSHCHLNHSSDLNSLISAATHNGLDRQAVLICPKSIVEDTQGYEKVLHNYYRECLERTIVVTPGNKVGIEKVEVRVLTAKHNEEHAVGFKIITPRFTMVYSGDTEFFKEMFEDYKEVDILLLNMQEGFEKKEKGHLSADDVVKLVDKIKPNLCVITHYGNKLSDPMDIAREIQLKTNRQILAAKDGMIINPYTYSAGQRQKTLGTF